MNPEQPEFIKKVGEEDGVNVFELSAFNGQDPKKELENVFTKVGENGASSHSTETKNNIIDLQDELDKDRGEIEAELKRTYEEALQTVGTNTVSSVRNDKIIDLGDMLNNEEELGPDEQQAA